ncbi:hypothetical protein SPONN_2354 [uncultured Candidatus Thioglobus sp.]|nr:hypothetical protein SPONN_2354 [uncultured Candidatus Thioglobus sp.]
MLTYLLFNFQVLWKRLFSKLSGRDRGSLFQLRNLLGRSSVPSDPQDDMKAAEDFLLVVLHAHAICAAKAISSIVDVHSVMDLSCMIVANYTLLDEFSDHMFKEKNSTSEPKTKTAKRRTPQPKSSQPEAENEPKYDLVNLYAKELLTLGLLWHGFHDASKESDGDRSFRHWKFLVVIFKSSRNYNYAKDAVNLIVSHKYLLSERKAAQLLWCRTVNTRGYSGCNIPMDLHMEHLNRRLKSIIANVGANKSDKTIVKAAKTLRAVHKVCEIFHNETAKSTTSDKHPYPAFDKDLKKVLIILEEVEVFATKEKREHSCFIWKKGLLQTMPKANLVEAVKKNVKQLINK